MFKIVFFLWRREGLSPAEFRSYYEDKHAHNNQKVRPASADYRRNYPQVSDPWTDAEALAKLGGFDVMTENFYLQREAFANVLKVMSDSPVFHLVKEDEAQFEIRTKKKVFVCHETPTLDYNAPDYEDKVQRNEKAKFKLLRYVRRAEGVSPEEFQRRYEQERAPAMRDIFKNSVEYRRSYLLFEDPLTFHGAQEEPKTLTRDLFPCDAVEEIWYEDRAAAEPDYARYREAMKVLPASAPDAADSPLVVVAECRMPRPKTMAAAAP